jgi:hypothetical protein
MTLVPGVPRRTPEHGIALLGTPRLPGIRRGTPGYPGVPRGTQGYPEVSRGAGAPRGTSGYPGIPRGTPGYPGVPRGRCRRYDVLASRDTRRHRAPRRHEAAAFCGGMHAPSHGTTPQRGTATSSRRYAVVPRDASATLATWSGSYKRG